MASTVSVSAKRNPKNALEFRFSARVNTHVVGVYARGTMTFLVGGRRYTSREALQRFFQEQGERIQPLMQDAGFTSEPEITFWTKLETGDDIGW